MYALFREVVTCMTGGEFASRSDVDEVVITNCKKCGEQSFLQKEFDVCPHCLGWDHENDVLADEKRMASRGYDD